MDVVLGVNGFVWVGKHVEDEENNPDGGSGGGTRGVNINTKLAKEAADNDKRMYTSVNEHISAETRREIARVGGCVRVLVEAGKRVDEETVVRAYEACVEEEDAAMDEGMMEGEGQRNLYLDGERAERVVRMAVSEAG